MSTDTFEDDLRSLMHEAADAEGAAYVDVDPTSVVAAGRRVVRRRRMAAGAGIAAAVLAIGATGAVVGGVRQNRADITVPAGPTSGLGRGTVSVDLDVSSVLQGRSTPSPDDPASARVDVNEQTLRWQVAVTGRDGRRTTRPADTLPANPRFSTYAEVGDGPGLVVGVMPAAATDIVAVWRTGSVESSFSSAPVPGTDRQVFTVQYSFTPDPNVPGSTMFAGFDWTDGQNVFTSVGTSVRSARLGDAVVFVDEIHGLFGSFGPGTTASKQLSDTPRGKLPAMMTGKVLADSNTMESTVLVILPAGAQRVTVSAASGATVQSVDTVPGGSTGRNIVLVRLTMPKDTPGTGVDHVSWTSPDGGARSSAVG